MSKDPISFLCKLLIFCSLTSCRDHPTNFQASANLDFPSASRVPVTPVKTLTLKYSKFNRELISNGKLEAPAKADLRFKAQGTIVDILVNDGESVKAGQLLAALDDQVQIFGVQQAKLRLERSKLEYEDQLLRLGYRLSDTVNLDDRVKQISQIRSGFSDAVIQLRQAELDLNNTRLIAPFSGRIANMNARTHNSTSSFNFVCTLVDNGRFNVKFPVLEEELAFVRNCENVTVSSFTNQSKDLPARITSISPLVDENGMVVISALVLGFDPSLLDGMGVQVVISESVPSQIVVPKAALLERQGRKVVFTLSEKNTASWNYVEIADENSHEFAIKKGIKAGDKVIYDGNFNLSHDKPVTVIGGM